MSKPTIKSLTEQLETGEKQYQVLRKEKNATQSLLDAANKEVAQLLQLKDELRNTISDKDDIIIAQGSEIEQLKDDLVNANSDIEKLIKLVNDVSAENYALKAEIERTNRHINLAENQLNKEQQPLVVNHYHNCTINK